MQEVDKRKQRISNCSFYILCNWILYFKLSRTQTPFNSSEGEVTEELKYNDRLENNSNIDVNKFISVPFPI